MDVPLADVPDALAVDGSGNIFATSPGKVQELPITLTVAPATTATTAPAGLPSLAVTGEATARRLAAAAGLVGLVLAARQMRRRLDISRWGTRRTTRAAVRRNRSQERGGVQGRPSCFGAGP